MGELTVSAPDLPLGVLRASLRRRGYLLLRGGMEPAAMLRTRRALLSLDRGHTWVTPCGAVVPGRRPADIKKAALLNPANYRKLMALPEIEAIPRDERLRRFLVRLFPAPFTTPHLYLLRVVVPDDLRSATPPHQDVAYISELLRYRCWIPLGSCSRRVGGLAVMEGSHVIHGTLPTRRDPDAYLNVLRSDIEGLRFPWMTASYQAGDVLVFSNHLVHAALPNVTPDLLRLSVEFSLMFES